MIKKVVLCGLLLVVAALLLVSCSGQEEGAISSGSRESKTDRGSAQPASELCAQLTPELVREICAIAPDLNLALSDKPRYTTSWTNCGAVEGYRTSQPNAVLIAHYSATEDFGYFTVDSLQELATTAPGGPRGSRDVEGLNAEYAFVTPQIGKQTMDTLDTEGYILYFGKMGEAQRTLRSNGDVPAQNIEGCSLEEGKELVRRLLEGG